MFRMLLFVPLIPSLAFAEDFFVVFQTPDARLASQAAQPQERSAAVVSQLQRESQTSQAEVIRFLRGRRMRFESFWISNRILVRGGDKRLMERLRRFRGVVAIEPERRYPLIEPIDPKPASPTPQGVEWGVQQIRAPEVWALGFRGQGIVVATIDTGAFAEHPALKAAFRSGPGGWLDPTGICSPSDVPCDNNGHGTHVLGTMLGDDGAGNQIGVAPAARWIACKGCAGRDCEESKLLACAQWILDPFGDGKGAGQPDIVNCSWGGAGGQPWFRDAVNAWRAVGIFTAFAAGNLGGTCDTTGSPGDYPESFASGAVDINANIADFSSKGPSKIDKGIKPNLSAPGVAVRSSYPGSTYQLLSGTSMASPHTAGAVALLWSALPAFKRRIVETARALEESAVPKPLTNCGELSPRPNYTFGWGLLDVRAARDRLGGVTQPPLITSLSPDRITAGGPDFFLTVNGSGFRTGAVVLWNNAPVVTDFGSASQLNATIPASLILQPGTASVVVRNPSGELSAPAVFTITPPPPPPSLTITQPLITFRCPVGAHFGGEAADATDGDLSSRIIWFDGDIPFYDGALGFRLYSCKPEELGIHKITAQVTNSAGLTTKTSIEIRLEQFPNAVKVVEPSGSEIPCGRAVNFRAEYSGDYLAWYVDDQFVWFGSPAEITLPCDGAAHEVRAEALGIGEARLSMTGVQPTARKRSVSKR
jgi:subtilisin family serine protease